MANNSIKTMLTTICESEVKKNDVAKNRFLLTLLRDHLITTVTGCQHHLSIALDTLPRFIFIYIVNPFFIKKVKHTFKIVKCALLF